MDKLARTLRLGCVQLKVGANKSENVARAISKIREAKMKGAEVVSLPECFNSLYGTAYFNGESTKLP
jgi:omega-amidase